MESPRKDPDARHRDPAELYRPADHYTRDHHPRDPGPGRQPRTRGDRDHDPADNGRAEPPFGHDSAAPSR